MGFVRSLAFRYRDLGVPVEDLVQEGAIGLLSAIDDYDPSRGASFSTFSFWRARAAITHAVTAGGNVIRIPRPVLERRRQVSAARAALSAAGREPTVNELAAETRLTADEVVEAMGPAGVISLDALFVEGAQLSDGAAERPDDVTADATEQRALRFALKHLRPRKRAIVARHFGIDRRPETLAEIAADLHLSPERTRALKDEALRDLASELATPA